MPEHIRSVSIAVAVDTNKRTMYADIEADSLDDALDQVREHLSDVRWSIR
jgi:predicted regulator of amino acid metabolism with ACT domain